MLGDMKTGIKKGSKNLDIVDDNIFRHGLCFLQMGINQLPKKLILIPYNPRYFYRQLLYY